MRTLLGRAFPRHAEDVVALALEDTRVVLVNGARQSGKSTLARLVAKGRNAEWRDLDTALTRQAALEDPDGVADLIARDVQQLSEIERTAEMRALVQMLAARSGQLVSIATLSNELGLGASTVKRYVALLEEVFLIKRIPAWSRNISSRATTTPKLAFVDSGIAAHQIGADARSLLRPTGQFGPLLEGFVMMELARQLSWSDEEVELFHYRTRDQIEVDVVLENRRGEVVGIEVKAASTVGPNDFRGLRHLADRLGDNFRAGIVLHTGQQTLPFGQRMLAMPVSAVWETGV